MDLDFVKSFLHIDVPDEDEYIALLMDAADEYIKSGVGGAALDESGNVDEAKALVRLLKLNIICSLYEQRGYTIDGLSEKAQYTMRSIINQLMLGGDVGD